MNITELMDDLKHKVKMLQLNEEDMKTDIVDLIVANKYLLAQLFELIQVCELREVNMASYREAHRMAVERNQIMETNRAYRHYRSSL